MAAHRLRPGQDLVERARPPLNGVRAAEAPSGERADPPDVPFAVTWISPEARKAADGVLASGWVTTGHQTELFESAIASRVGAGHAIAVSSCTAALELALRGLALPPGAAVLIPDVTFCGAAHAILHAGLRPVLVDVDPRTATPTADTVARAAAACGRPRAMMVLHYAGAPTPVAELAEAAGLPLTRVVEDAAHALGTSVGGRAVGSLSGATCFSFYATKNLPIGEGGMVTTDDPELAVRIRRSRLNGMSADAWRRTQPGGRWRYTVEDAGLKANMTDVQAAIGRAQLRHFDDWQRRRHSLAARYDTLISAIPGIQPLDVATPGRHARHLYVVRVLAEYGTSRDELVDALSQRGIGTSVHFIPLHQLPFFRRTALTPLGGLPGADALFPQLLSLPMHPFLTERVVDRVCAELALPAPGRPAASPFRTGRTAEPHRAMTGRYAEEP